METTTTILKRGIKSKQPTSVTPMLATLLKEPFEDPKYVYEIKWDGYRIIAHKTGNDITLHSRGGLDYTGKYPQVADALRSLKQNFVIDGEVVVLNGDGKPDFDALQKFNGTGSIVYYVFDLIWCDGYDLSRLPLITRKDILKSIVKDSSVIRYSESFEEGILLFDHVKTSGLEGIIAKQRDSHYLPGNRSSRWFKIPVEKMQEFVIGGWLESDSGRPFKSLLFGAYNGHKLEWIGHASGGFREGDMPAILKKLKQLEIRKSPFDTKVDFDGRPHWIKPQLVANIKYASFTRSGRIRKPAIFLGFRQDKAAEEVIREKAGKLPQGKIKS